MRRNLTTLLSRAVWMLALVLISNALLAQSRRVSGTVADADGPLTGATVALKGTTTGAVTDLDGKFTLEVSGANPVLVVSYTGYNTVEVGIGTQSSMSILLESSSIALEELIVSGYTVETRKQATSAVATVKTRDLAAVPTGNVEQQLQGRVSGLTVISNGQPGTTSQVRIRGFGSFFGNQPLFIVDGVPTQNIDFLAPDDIDNTTVMKDASSASIYGARAAGGVIAITTKRGANKPQRMQVSYDAIVGWTDPGQGVEVLNPQDQATWTWTALRNAGLATEHPQYGNGASPTLPDFINVGGLSGLNASQVNLDQEKAKYNVNTDNGPIYQIVRANKEGTDWYGAITRTAPMTRHNLGFRGSTESARYYLGLSVQNQSGILIHNDFKRYTLRANTEFDVFKKFRIGQNMQVTYRSVLGGLGGGGGVNVAQDENPILGSFRMPTIIPVYDELNGYAGTAAKGFNNPRNPVAERDGVADNRGAGLGLFGNLYAEYDLLEGLTLRSSIGGNYGNYSGFGYNRRSYENSENNASFGYNEFYGNNYSWVWTNTVQYKKRFGTSNIEALLGQEALTDGRGRGINASGLDPFSEDPNYVTLNTVSNRNVSSFLNPNLKNYFSMFGRVHYSLMDKYYATAVVRRDGVSSFGPDTRYGVFPGFSAAWRVSGEEFMSDVRWLNDLKIRGGWGQMGNELPVTQGNQYSLFASTLGGSAYDINGSGSSVANGFYQSQVGFLGTKWEVSTTSNVGFEALLWNGKLDVIVDLWQKKTSDLLFNPALPNVVGSFATAPFKNLAEMENKGIDLQLINKGKFSSNVGYELTLTGSFLKNEIVKIDESINYFDVSPASNRLAGTMVRNQVGQSISAFFGYQVEGIFQSASEVASAPTQEGAGVGRFRYADLDGYDESGRLTGVPDGKIDAADRTFIGSPVPKFTGGLNFKVTVGQFDAETYVYTSVGNKIFHLAKWFTDFYPSFKGAAIGARVTESWSTSNTGSENPIFEDVSNFSTNTQPNSWYVEDGSYLRIQNLSIGYNLSPDMLKRLKLTRARIFASTNNLLTITKYKGLDPSVGGAADTNFGIDVGNYPITRSVMVGVGVTF